MSVLANINDDAMLAAVKKELPALGVDITKTSLWPRVKPGHATAVQMAILVRQETEMKLLMRLEERLSRQILISLGMGKRETQRVYTSDGIYRFETSLEATSKGKAGAKRKAQAQSQTNDEDAHENEDEPATKGKKNKKNPRPEDCIQFSSRKRSQQEATESCGHEEDDHKPKESKSYPCGARSGQ
jgi:hypothetical protein